MQTVAIVLCVILIVSILAALNPVFKIYDLSNWFVFVFTIIVWPVALFCWNNRKFRSIPGLEINLNRGAGSVGGVKCNFLDIIFLNNTGKIIYLTNVRISKITQKFPVFKGADRDIFSHSYELKFLDNEGNYKRRQIVLNAGEKAKTGFPFSQKASEEILEYRANFWFRKYFSLEFTALIDEKKYMVEFDY